MSADVIRANAEIQRPTLCADRTILGSAADFAATWLAIIQSDRHAGFGTNGRPV